ncbi:MAG: phosphopantothenoylcysteine decarboxylase [Chthoniobacterales bacterium]
MSTCLVTCGPASTRIDAVRRITNFSTGELGTLLAEALHTSGHEVICLRGEGATFRPPIGMKVESFFSNSDLLTMLRRIAESRVVHQVFHAAALTDFEVTSIMDDMGRPLLEDKIGSSIPILNIRLKPAGKVIVKLRRLFPHARITGWKYELSGTTEEASQKAIRQMEECQTDACVLNGAAIGSGFACLTKNSHRDFSNKQELANFLSANVPNE